VTSIIRFAESQDAAAIQAIYAPFCEQSSTSFELVAPSVAQIAERIGKVSVQYPWLVCEVDGHVGGYVYASQFRERAAYRWCVDVTVYLAERFRRRGIGSALYTALFAMLREQNYFKAYAGVTLPNPGSVRIHESLGFTPLAVYRNVGYKFGRWHDVGWWELDLQPAIPTPPEPRPITSIRSSAVVDAALARGVQILSQRANSS
jgi:phosphinothricin acetyltransferase